MSTPTNEQIAASLEDAAGLVEENVSRLEELKASGYVAAGDESIDEILADLRLQVAALRRSAAIGRQLGSEPS